MPCCKLSDVPAGCRVRVRRLCDKQGERGRLCALGITPGTELEVCSQGGACCVRVRDASLVLGDTLACDVYCEPVHSGRQIRD
ncbi:MAG: ferrous iron transport protein A [Desulfovibrio sp.]|nr:ferrous iron transport protein A [Desulfovibrio sp.]